MNELISQGSPRLGSTEIRGVISAPRHAGQCGTQAEGGQAHTRAVDPEAPREILVHDHRPCVEPEAGKVEQGNENQSKYGSDDDQREAVCRIGLAQKLYGAG